MGKRAFTLTARECLPEWIVQKSVHAEALDVLLDKKIVIEYDKEVYREVKTNVDERKITLTKKQE